MKKNTIIIILSLIILVLLGFLFLGGEKSETPKTEDDCVALAEASFGGYDHCREVGAIKLYGFDDGIDCLEDFGVNADLCRGSRWAVESLLQEECLEKFPPAASVLVDCLADLK